jgi:hypothetical protein
MITSLHSTADAAEVDFIRETIFAMEMAIKPHPEGSIEPIIIMMILEIVAVIVRWVFKKIKITLNINLIP